MALHARYLIAALALTACGKDEVEDTAGSPEDDLPAQYFDSDRDGWLENEDCDDENDRVFPGAREGCDDIDNDCDGIIDEDPDDADLWYADMDGDGYGDLGETQEACDQPEDFAARAGDCDDSEATTNPDAPEICGDGVDNNCGGGDRPCGWGGDIGLPDADVVLGGQVTQGRAGCAVSAPGDFDGDGEVDVLVGACLADEAGMAYLLRGPFDASRELADADARLEGGLKGAEMGAAVAGSDLDSDGRFEWLVSAPSADTSAPDAGEVYLLSAASGVLEVADDGIDHLYGSALGDNAGRVLATAADVLLVGVPLYEPLGGEDTGTETGADTGMIAENMGAVWVLQGPYSGRGGIEEVAIGRLDGESDADNAGRAVAAGDLNGDGIVDAVVGAWRSDITGEDAGATYVVLGPLDGVRSLADADVRLLGESERNGSGFAVTVLSDMDGDGLDDVAIGAPQAAAVYLVNGLGSGLLSGDVGLADADAKLEGTAASEEVGYALAGGGDVDGDGVPDLLVGAPGAGISGADSGAVFVVPGPLTGTSSLGATGARLVGQASSDRAGEALSSADVNGDGLLDILVGAPGVDEGAADLGAVYLLFGGE